MSESSKVTLEYARIWASANASHLETIANLIDDHELNILDDQVVDLVADINFREIAEMLRVLVTGDTPPEAIEEKPGPLFAVGDMVKVTGGMAGDTEEGDTIILPANIIAKVCHVSWLGGILGWSYGVEAAGITNFFDNNDARNGILPLVKLA